MTDTAAPITYKRTTPGYACKLAAWLGAKWEPRPWGEAAMDGPLEVAYRDSTGYHVQAGLDKLDVSDEIA